MVVKIAIARGRALAIVDKTGGGMVAVSGCDASAMIDHIDAASALSECTGTGMTQLHLAAFNSPTDIGVSGAENQIDVLTSYINKWVDGVTAHKLRISTAVHSPFVDPCQEQYRAELAAIFDDYDGPCIPTTLTMSTVTGEFKYDAYTIDYLWNNLRQPVLFSAAIGKVIEKFGDGTTFVEISPHPVLSQVRVGERALSVN
jgi:fatty acid synthase